MKRPYLLLECRLEGPDRQTGRLPYCDAERRVTNQLAALPDGTPDAH